MGGRWPWLALAFALMLPTYLIVSCRFWLVLRNQGIDVPTGAGRALDHDRLLFDLAMPSNSGGDLIKARTW